MSDATRSWVDQMPVAYERGLVPAVFEPFAVRLAARVAALRPRRVLELAAGTGVLTRELSRAAPEASLVATDLNDAMVLFGSSRAPKATWRTADATALPFEPDAFDLVTCQFGVMFFPTRVAAFGEVLRILSPGGAFVFNTWAELERHGFQNALVEALRRALPEDPPTFMEAVPHGYHDHVAIRADLRAAGFAHVDIDTVEVTGYAASAADLARGYCEGTPLRSQLAERGDVAELEARVVQEMELILGGPGPVAALMTAYEVSASFGS